MIAVVRNPWLIQQGLYRIFDDAIRQVGDPEAGISILNRAIPELFVKTPIFSFSRGFGNNQRSINQIDGLIMDTP
jgi:hypothetical protein